MSNAEDAAKILGEYDASYRTYLALAEECASLIKTILDSESLNVLSVTYRCKSRESLERKIRKPEKSYKTISDITDISALRITTYFASDVDRVASIVTDEFLIDATASIDKRRFDDPQRFGYQSLHFVATLSDKRRLLREWIRFEGIRFEIQIRSVLQHAWAEIEHDLGYKSTVEIPVGISRRFSRISSLLELADSEFDEIRNILATYESQVHRLIDEHPDQVPLSKPALDALHDAGTFSHLDQFLTEETGAAIDDTGDILNESIIKSLQLFEITTAEALKMAAIDNSETVHRFIKYWLGQESYVSFSKAAGLFYLLYVLARKTNSRAKILQYLDIANIGPDREKVADRILNFDL